MSPSNLGIVFGPSLMRPRPTGATISLSSLVDYPHQARIVEALIVFYSSIFQSKSSQPHKTSRAASSSAQQVTNKCVVRFDVIRGVWLPQDEVINTVANQRRIYNKMLIFL